MLPGHWRPQHWYSCYWPKSCSEIVAKTSFWWIPRSYRKEMPVRWGKAKIYESLQLNFNYSRYSQRCVSRALAKRDPLFDIFTELTFTLPGHCPCIRIVQQGVLNCSKFDHIGPGMSRLSVLFLIDMWRISAFALTIFQYDTEWKPGLSVLVRQSRTSGEFAKQERMK